MTVAAKPQSRREADERWSYGRFFQLLGEASRVLDLGCGAGRLGKWKPHDGMQVIGIDSSRTLLQEASAWETVVACDLDDGHLPFGDRSFDGVIAKDVIEHLAKPWELAAEIHRVLRPGGRLVATSPLPKPRAVWADYTHVRGFTRVAYCQLFTDAGFVVERAEYGGGLRGAGRLGMTAWLPTLLNIPVLGYHLANNNLIIAVKPAEPR